MQSNHYIKSVAQEKGFEIVDEKVVSYVANSAKQQLSKMIELAMKFRKHSNSDSLTKQNIDDAIRMTFELPVIGCSIPSEFLNSNSSQISHKNISVKNDPIIKLQQMKKDMEMHFRPSEPSVIVQWLQINGVVPQSYTATIPTNVMNDENSLQSNTNILHSGNEIINPLVSHAISREQQLFFEKLTNSVLNCNHKILFQLLDILQNSDAGLAKLVPKIVQFIAVQVKENVNRKNFKKKNNDSKDGNSLDMLYCCMCLCQSIIESRFLSSHLENYLQQLMPAILTCALKDKLSLTPFDNHWNLRLKAAENVRLVMDKFGDRYPNFRKKTLKTLEKHFCHKLNSFNTHFGVIAVLKYLGCSAIEVVLLPKLMAFVQERIAPVLLSDIKRITDVNHFKQFMNYNTMDVDNNEDVDIAMDVRNNNSRNMRFGGNAIDIQSSQNEAKIVMKLILECLWMCKQKYLKSGGSENEQMNILQQVLSQLTEMFGDHLLPFQETLATSYLM